MSSVACVSLRPMTATTCHMSISLDGFVAGPSQSRENPLGVGGMQLHGWHLGEVADDADLMRTCRLPGLVQPMKCGYLRR